MLLVNLEDSKYTCPLTQHVFEFPLKTPCEHNFEAEWIYSWLEEKQICPCCQAPLTAEQLVENHELRAAIASAQPGWQPVPLLILRTVRLAQEQLDAVYAFELAKEFEELDKQVAIDAVYARTLRP